MHLNHSFILMPNDDSGEEDCPERQRRREAEAEREALPTRDLPERWRLMPLTGKALEDQSAAAGGVSDLALWFGVIGTLLVLFMAGWAVPAVERQARTVQFLPASGVIIESDLEKREFNVEHQTHESVTPIIVYDYIVDGQPYTGSRIRHGLATIDGDAARELHEAHPVGAPVTVYHDPANPKRAVLQTGLVRHDYLALWMVIGGMCIVIAWWMHLLPHRMAAKGRHPARGGGAGAGGASIRTYGPCINARMTTLPPIAVALGVGLMILTNGLTWLIATRPDLSPFAWVSLTLLAAAALGALAGWAWSLRHRAERHWLTIDTKRQLLITQGISKELPPRDVSLNDVTAITLGGLELRRPDLSPSRATSEGGSPDDGPSPEDPPGEESSQEDTSPAPPASPAPPSGTLVLLQVRDEADPRHFAVPAASFSDAACAVRFARWLGGTIDRPLRWREEAKSATATAAVREARQSGSTG